ncbi:MAG: toll/interleukin-1 receptor domain-containing protein [Desulfobacterales bacterium]|nr:toll/interleukin-1 receptor domain-containing protein [Desulfobacterales bacterium]
MANKEFLKILKQGVTIWNKWRKDNPNVKLDLQEANLQEANLQEANLQGIDLQRANLQRADLQRANLWMANLQEANLQEADLQRTDLQEANLQRANLQGTNLQGTNLQRADLQGADLQGADLQEIKGRSRNIVANLQEVDLQRANLQRAKLHGAYFYEANLRESNLTEADFEKANLERADLQLANIERIYLQDANLKFLRINSESLSHIPESIRQQYGKTWLVTSQVRKEDTEKLIIRSIKFPPEYHQAGISILNYFGTVLRKKYPDVKATVQIKQEGLKVTMIIDPVEGEREIIEKALDEYGLVVTGKMTPEKFTHDNLLLIELKSEMRAAQNKIETQKELIQYQNRELKKQDNQTEQKDIQINRLLNLLESGLKSDSEKKEQPTEIRVFISCAEDDILIANKIYADLQKKHVIPWLSHKDINAGKNTDFAIRKAITDSDYFLALLSTSSVNGRGMFQKELKQAFDILAEFPQDGIFIVPVCLDDCNPTDEILKELRIIDLHKTSFNNGLEQIMQVFLA